MSLNVYAFTCGWLTVPAALLLAGETGRLTVPVPSYLIEHPKGRVIFDSGLHVDTQTDADRRRDDRHRTRSGNVADDPPGAGAACARKGRGTGLKRGGLPGGCTHP